MGVAEKIDKPLRRLNLGCGLQTLDGFDNLDGSPNVLLSRIPLVKKALFAVGALKPAHMATFPSQIIWTRLPAGLSRYPDASADRIYTSHFLEHLSLPKAEQTLREIYRILSPGGILRLVLPDTRFYAAAYLESVTRMIDDGSNGTEPRDRLMAHVAGGYFSRNTGHRVAWDLPSAESALRAVGFATVERQTFRLGRDLEMAAVDNRENDSLFLEAVR